MTGRLLTRRGSDTSVSDPWERLSWLVVLRVATARGALVVVASLMLCALLPLAIGWTPRVILSGSMEPRLPAGDVVVTRAVDPADLRRGHIVTVRDPDREGRTRTHRVVRRDEGRLVTRGDANGQVDSTPVDPGDVLGLGVLRVPWVGLPAHWASERSVVALSLAASGLAALVLSAGMPGSPGGRGPRSPRAPGRRLSARLRPVPPGAAAPLHRARGSAGATASWIVVGAVVAGAATAVAGSLVVTGSYAAFGSQVSDGPQQFSASPTFRPYARAVAADAPMLWWRLDLAPGTTATAGVGVDDASGNGRHATLSCTSCETGVAGALPSEPPQRALRHVDRTVVDDDQLSSPLSTVSIEAWIRTTSSHGGRVLGFGSRGGQDPSDVVDEQLYVGSDAKPYFTAGSDRATVVGSAPLDDGAWHHLVGTIDADAAMTLYVDGVAQGTVQHSPQTFDGYWRGGAEDLSGFPGSPGDWFVGDLDELAVYPTVLSPARVRAHIDAATE